MVHNNENKGYPRDTTAVYSLALGEPWSTNVAAAAVRTIVLRSFVLVAKPTSL